MAGVQTCGIFSVLNDTEKIQSVVMEEKERREKKKK